MLKLCGTSSKAPLKRFQEVVKFVIWNRDILHQFQENTMQNSIETTNEYLIKNRNLNNYQLKETRQIIPEAVIQLATKPSFLRTGEDITKILNAIKDLPFFMRLDQGLLEKISRIIYYQSLGKGRIIVRRGYNPIYMYYIINGRVSVSYSEHNLTTNQINEIELAEIDEGCYFAELDLIQKSKREFTFITKELAQFFVIENDDFDELLSDIILKDINERQRLLLKMPTFNEIELDEQQIRIISTYSKIMTYPKDKVIIGGSDKQSKDIYFIISGSCKFVRAVNYTLNINKLGEVQYRLPVTPDNFAGEIYKALLEVCIVKFGSYFGIGEDTSKTYLIALDNVSCLLIPKTIMYKFGLGKHIDKLIQIHNEIYPSEQTVLDLYCKQNKLLKLQNKIIKNTIL
ncbi:cyclic nucleotide-binding domain-containing protein 2-like [Centruroides vittatus]|uniref:cyclic nucleotide-binding domain-containing protein 2-like n=1 Tax=Centruroides vittatus TaxID=120091 RepID=UPI003510AF52